MSTPEQRERPYELTVDRSGPDSKLMIGTDAGCDIILDDEYASRRHCVIRVKDHKAVLSDLGSMNGVLLSGLKVYDAVLSPGAYQLRLGHSDLLVVVR